MYNLTSAIYKEEFRKWKNVINSIREVQKVLYCTISLTEYSTPYFAMQQVTFTEDLQALQWINCLYLWKKEDAAEVFTCGSNSRTAAMDAIRQTSSTDRVLNQPIKLKRLCRQSLSCKLAAFHPFFHRFQSQMNEERNTVTPFDQINSRNLPPCLFWCIAFYQRRRSTAASWLFLVVFYISDILWIAEYFLPCKIFLTSNGIVT